MINNKGKSVLIIVLVGLIGLIAGGTWLYFYDKSGVKLDSSTGGGEGDLPVERGGHTDANGQAASLPEAESAPPLNLPAHLTASFWENISPQQLTETLKTVQNINQVRPDTGQSMLHLVVMHGQGKHPEVISQLINAGVDPHYKDKHKDGTSGRPLFFASALGPSSSLPYTKELLKHDTQVNEPGNVFFDGVLFTATALNRAVFHRMPFEGIKLLLDKGADPNYATNNNITSLMMSVIASSDGPVDPSTTQLLLDRGADKSVKSAEGKSAYDYLMENTQIPNKDSAVFKTLAEKLKTP